MASQDISGPSYETNNLAKRNITGRRRSKAFESQARELQNNKTEESKQKTRQRTEQARNLIQRYHTRSSGSDGNSDSENVSSGASLCGTTGSKLENNERGEGDIADQYEKYHFPNHPNGSTLPTTFQRPSEREPPSFSGSSVDSTIYPRDDVSHSGHSNEEDSDSGLPNKSIASAQSARRRREVEKLRGKLRDAAQERAELLDKYKEMQRRCMDLEAQRDELRDSSILSGEDIKKSETYQTLLKVLQQCQAEKRELYKRLGEAEAKEIELNSSLMKATAEIADQTVRISDLQALLVDARMECTTLQQSQSALRHQLDETRMHTEQQTAELAREANHYANYAIQLERELHAAQQRGGNNHTASRGSQQAQHDEQDRPRIAYHGNITISKSPTSSSNLGIGSRDGQKYLTRRKPKD